MKTLMILALASVVSWPAFAQSGEADIAFGEAVAQRACSGCHVIGKGTPASQSDRNRPFLGMANDPATTVDGLRNFLMAPHPSMPDFSLTRREIDVVVSYILSLRTQP